MAYITRHSTNARSATIAAVAGLHVAAVWALINGLGIEYLKERVFVLPTTNYESESPPPAPEPPRAEPSPSAEPRIIAADPMVDTSGPIVFRLPPVELPSLPDLVPPLLPKPGPSIDPGQRFEAVGPRPAGRPGLWITTNDYPTRDIREGNEGAVAFRLSVSAKGKVTGCEVLKGSGHPGLDAATCDKLLRRPSFEPARDGSGERVAGSYTGTVRWVIPE